jgi:predicted glutamine amidotransferase
MCRLFGFRASWPTRIECGLIKAQNSLINQGMMDREGLSHGHGWGFAAYHEHVPLVEKQAWAAWEGEHFQKSAAHTYARTFVAHVRRATVGPPSIENTHPFVHGVWSFAHNGTVPGFDAVRTRLLDAMDPLHRNEIAGETDSEHIFRYLLSLWQVHPERALSDTLRIGLYNIIRWSAEAAPGKPISLNIIWTNGEEFTGSRLNRTLSYLERDSQFFCPLCRKPHMKRESEQNHKVAYRSVDIASESITAENWHEVPNGSIFSIDEDTRIWIEPLDLPASAGVSALAS